MNRIIINNKTELSDNEAIAIVADIIGLGRVSKDGKQYCYLTDFYNHKIHVVTDLRKKSDSFTIYKPQPITNKN